MSTKNQTGRRRLATRKKDTSCPILHTSSNVLCRPGMKSDELYVIGHTQLKATSGFIRDDTETSYPLANQSGVVMSASLGPAVTVNGKSAVNCRRCTKKVRNCRSLNSRHRVQVKHLSKSSFEDTNTKFSIREAEGGQGCFAVKEKRKCLVKRKCRPVEGDVRRSPLSHAQAECSKSGRLCSVKTSSRMTRECSRDNELNVKLRSKSNLGDIHQERGSNSKSLTKLSVIKSFQPIIAHKRTLHNAHSTHKKLAHNNTTSSSFFGDTSSKTNFHLKRSKSELKEMSRKTSRARLTSSTQKENVVSSMLHLDKSDSKPPFKKVHQDGVVRTTRIVRKNKTSSNSIGSYAPRVGKNNLSMKNTLSLFPVNPCDDGKLESNKTSQVLEDIMNRWDGDKSDARPSNKETDGLKDVAQSKTLMPSDAELVKCSATTLHTGTCAVDQHKSLKRISKYNANVDGTSQSYVHVTRIKKKVTTPARNLHSNNSHNNSNNNADYEPDDVDEAETKTSKSDSDEKRSSVSSKSSTPKEPEDSGSRSSELTSQESEDKETIPEVSSPNVTKKTPDKSRSAKFQPQPAAEAKKKKMKRKRSAKIKESRTKKLLEIEAAENKKSPVPPCPLFQGWDFDRELGVHNMDRLPLESDLAAQLSKISKQKIWEARGRPQNVSSMLRCSLPSTNLVTEDLKTYLARHSIEEFIQQLTNSVMLLPRGDVVLEALIEQCRSFKEKLKFDIETDEFLKFVFSRLGSKPIAFPSATKTRSIDMDQEYFDESVSETPRTRRSMKRSIDIVIGMPGIIYEPRMSARSDFEKSSTLQIRSSDPFHRDSSYKSSTSELIL